MFLDDDTFLMDPSTTKRTHNLLEKSRADFFLGATRYWTYPFDWFKRISEACLYDFKQRKFTFLSGDLRLRPECHGRFEFDPEFADLLSVSFIANYGWIRRSAFESVGGFDPRFELGDDDLMTYRLQEKFLGVADPGVAVVHMSHGRLTQLSESEWGLLEGEIGDFCTLSYIRSLRGN